MGRLVKEELIIGRDPATGQPVRLHIKDGRIASIEPGPKDCDLWISAGLIDLQVNGFAGRDFNGPEAMVQGVVEIVDAMLATGVTCFAPTVITASEAMMLRSLEVIAKARKASQRAAACIPFVHVEGPHISPLDGYRGAHPQEHVRPPSLEEFDRWQKSCGDLVGMVTMSPHHDDSAQYIAGLVARGIHVSLGHTHASTDQIHCAVEAGARLSTHLGNALAATLPRHPNPIWSQLAEDRLTASFIADGHHLPAETFKAMVRAKGIDQSILVSDMVALSGMPPGIYVAPVGGNVELSEDGRLSLLGSTALAGATVPLAQCIGKAVRMSGRPLSEVLRMATEIPGRFVNNRGRIAVGSSADLIRFRWTGELILHDVWLNGELIVL
ncbi:N-acetylglucosamine-6-phosphate deacetylase [Terriglobus sp. TAA 43]|uniref:N-acetylglucosamine-6-phosphate deacetylase n=1 Tax=Terriglobus sp. TAA 43 TaxID=278961 RepID=UPI0006487D67|nr:amidohydrolase family protein [Terriglobus sp. TAA 43]